MTTPTPTKIDQTKSQLQMLIARGKEQGYLTYAEVNDHLPNDIVDPEQIEDIVNMINDMGITVYEKAPDAEALILSDNAVSNDDDAADEAAAALATVDSEFGRTTDPVRMYMREMGTVELLTREGEIRIAKRIEKGLNQVRGALVMFPPTADLLLEIYEPVRSGESRLVDVIAGFIDPNQTDEVQKPKTKNGSSDDDDDDEKEVDTGPDPEEAKKRFAKIKRLQIRVLKLIEEVGSGDPKTMKARKSLAGEILELKLTPKVFDRLVIQLRDHGGSRAPAGTPGHDVLRARSENAAQGLHCELPG